MTDKTDAPPPIRPAADLIRELSNGATHDELSEGIRDLIARVIDTGKAGSVTLTITAELVKGTHNQVNIKDAIKVKLPEFDRAPSFFFADADFNLRRNDPNQMVFESLREVPPPGVDPKTGEILDKKAN